MPRSVHPHRISLLATFVLLGCEFGSDGTRPDPIDASEGIKVSSAGKVLRIGSDDSQAAPEERPGWVRFEHDFRIDTTEVTQEHFIGLVGRRPPGNDSAFPRRPVVNVSWFDAVLFCNERSKRGGLDTVYEYSSVQRDSIGSVWNLIGLISRPDREGWRLPTEAEWEFAARSGSDSAYPWGNLADSARALEYAWFARNAGTKLHDVATRKANPWGIHDMSGNAMEWVQDWKGPLPQDTLAGYAGLAAPGDVPETPLKGGAYGYGLSNLRPSSRAATYPAYRSSKAEYVGFRCVRGAFRPRYLSGPGGEQVEAPPVAILVPDLPRRLGASSARLVFVNRSQGKGILSWIDYEEADPVVRSLPDPDPVFHPSISPDGRWVAWSTVMEGAVQPGRIKVRRLSRDSSKAVDLGEGAIPRWWTDGKDTFLVRSTALDNLSPQWRGTTTTAQRWSGGSLEGSVETWAAAGSYHDGRTGRFLLGGYRRLRRWDMDSGKESILFVGPHNGKGTGDTSQVCNVSAAPDGSGRVLLLDFGFPGVSTVLGRPYGIHEAAFVLDSVGHVVATATAPIAERQWEHMEWSNEARWAVSGAIDPVGAYRNLYLIDLESGRSERIASGTELWMPSLWIKGWHSPATEGGVDRDSACAYATPNLGASQEDFAAKAALFWSVRESTEVFFVGNSRFESGIRPALLPYRAFNFGFWGGQTLGDDRIVRDYVLAHGKRMKVLVLSLEPGYMFRDQSVVWNQIASSQGYLYDRNHGFWSDSVPTAFLEVARSRTFAPSGLYDTLGGADYSTAKTTWGGASPRLEVLEDYDFESPWFRENWDLLVALVRRVKAAGARVVLVNFPQSPHYASTPFAGRYGPTWSSYDSLLGRLRKLESSESSFRFLDLHQRGAHGFTDEDAMNEDHLSFRGAARATALVDSFIRPLLALPPP